MGSPRLMACFRRGAHTLSSKVVKFDLKGWGFSGSGELLPMLLFHHDGMCSASLLLSAWCVVLRVATVLPRSHACVVLQHRGAGHSRVRPCSDRPERQDSHHPCDISVFGQRARAFHTELSRGHLGNREFGHQPVWFLLFLAVVFVGPCSLAWSAGAWWDFFPWCLLHMTCQPTVCIKRR